MIFRYNLLMAKASAMEAGHGKWRPLGGRKGRT